MKIEINFNDDEWEKLKTVLTRIGLKKGLSDSQPIKDTATFELKGPDGKVKQREEGKSHAAG